MRTIQNRAGVLAALVAVLAGANACQRSPNDETPAPESISLVVHNHGFADVDIFAVPEGGALPLRLAMVTGESDAKVIVPGNALAPGGMLKVRVRAIGSDASWMSPSVSVGADAQLDIYNNGGGLSGSTLVPGVRAGTDRP